MKRKILKTVAITVFTLVNAWLIYQLEAQCNHHKPTMANHNYKIPSNG